MKTIKIKVVFISLCIILQGCVSVYKANPITLNEALTENKLMKVTTKDGEKIKTTSIIFHDGTYYAIKEKKGETLKIPLTSESVESIKVNNPGLTLLANIPLAAAYVFVLVYAVGAITY